MTPRVAAVTGGVFVLFGLYPVLAGLGAISVRFSRGVPPLVVIAVGLMFLLAGLSIINRGVFDGGVSDGRLTVVSYFLSLAILALICGVFAWAALGSGERHFSSWSSFAGHTLAGQPSERFGRIAFGICGGFLALLLVLTGVSGARHLRRAR